MLRDLSHTHTVLVGLHHSYSCQRTGEMDIMGLKEEWFNLVTIMASDYVESYQRPGRHASLGVGWLYSDPCGFFGAAPINENEMVLARSHAHRGTNIVTVIAWSPQVNPFSAKLPLLSSLLAPGTCSPCSSSDRAFLSLDCRIRRMWTAHRDIGRTIPVLHIYCFAGLPAARPTHPELSQSSRGAGPHK
jgi:hypothetical protein